MIIGANYLGNGKCEFTVWAPFRLKVDLEVISPQKVIIPMVKKDPGYWNVTVNEISVEASYKYLLDGHLTRPDPASQFQPEGVHGHSRFLNRWAFRWDDEGWAGIPIEKMIIYELHVGTFTPEGNFQAMIPRLEKLKEIGINTIELMPVAQFPGDRNWGYDGVFPFAVQNSYGGPAELKNLVNECHKMGIAVILDVVYNHLGPEGNYLNDFGPYFTDNYKTPWGKAINFDSALNDDVRNYFIQNALYWFDLFHIDALRLDAVHAIYDMSAHPFLQELAEEVEKFSATDGRKRYLIAESDLNDVRIIKPRDLGGFAFDAQWSDDFHHSLHTLLTEENSGYYQDFGELNQLVKCIREGYTYSGQYSIYRGRKHGNSSVDRPANQFVVFSQNHDQIGNRMLGERLSAIVPFEGLKVAAVLTAVSPYIPLLFMGEEYAEEAPFLYFVSCSDTNLIEAVRNGRKNEFEKFHWTAEPPDPQDIKTFQHSKITWENRDQGKCQVMLNFYRKLLSLRKEVSALKILDKSTVDVFAVEHSHVLVLKRGLRRSQVAALFNFGKTDSAITNPLPAKAWKKVIDTSDSLWNGPGSLLPRQIRTGTILTLRSLSAVIFQVGK